MRINRKELKRLAKQRMKEAPIHPMLVTLVYGLVTVGMSAVVSIVMMFPTGMALASTSAIMSRGMAPGTFSAMVTPAALLLPMFLYILMILVSTVLQYGYTTYSLHVADGVESGCLDIFAGFPRVGRVIPMNLALAGFYILWCLAILVPGMLLLMAAGAALFAFGSEILVSILLFAVYIGIIVALVLVTMRYLFANHALADDPEIGPLDAIRRSRALMRGRSGEGLLLQLSFLGWAMIPLGVYLVLVIVGVVVATAAANTMAAMMAVILAMIISLLAMIPLMLWLQPYMSTTISLYYRTLSPRALAQGDEFIPLPEPETPWRPEDEQL